LVVEAKARSERDARNGRGGRPEFIHDGAGDGAFGIVVGCAFGDLEVWAGAIGAGNELEDQRVDRFMEALFQGEEQATRAVARQVGVSVAPRMNVSRSSQGLSIGRGSIFSQVMHQDYREVVVALKGPQLAKDAGDEA